MSPSRASTPPSLPDDVAAVLRRLSDWHWRPLADAVLIACRRRNWPVGSLTRVLGTTDAALSQRIRRARTTERFGGLIVDICVPEQVILDVAGLPGGIPGPPARVRATLDGKKLTPARITRLRQMAERARVTGATPADDPRRKVSEKFSAELAELVRQGYTPYYLAQALGYRSPRAITARLERHHHRIPVPSVRGTPSGEYRGRKIGDPPADAPALGPADAARLRRAWRTAATRRQAWVDVGRLDPRRGELRERARAAASTVDDLLVELAAAGQHPARLADALKLVGRDRYLLKQRIAKLLESATDRTAA